MRTIDHLASYQPPDEIRRILEGHGTPNRIMSQEESPDDLLSRVTDTLFGVEESFGTSPQDTQELKAKFRDHFIRRDFIPGIPTLTNAG